MEIESTTTSNVRHDHRHIGEGHYRLNEIIVIKTEVTLEMIITYPTPLGTEAYLAAAGPPRHILIHLGCIEPFQ